VAIKMSLYEGIARVYLRAKSGVSASKMITSADSLSSIEASGVGFTSGLMTAILTCPIDVVNTRIKSGELANFGVVDAHVQIIRKDGVTALFRGVVPRGAILGQGSTVFWYLQATLMHMITGAPPAGAH
jgi:solute carrier family 25 folate transporter 32